MGRAEKGGSGKTWDLESEHYVRDGGNLSDGQPRVTCLALQRSNLQYSTVSVQLQRRHSTCLEHDGDTPKPISQKRICHSSVWTIQ